MARRAAATKNYFTFIKGLITEASPLTYPDNASLDEDNMDLKSNGSRARRSGMDYELNFAKQVKSHTDANVKVWAFDAFEWRGVGGSGSRNHVILQFGRYLYVHDLDVETISASPVAIQVTPPGGGGAVDYIDLDWFSTPAIAIADRVGDYPIDVTFGDGVLYICAAPIEPFFFEYDSDVDTYSVHQITHQVRDLPGIQSTQSGTAIGVDIRPTVYDKTHEYNLLNQGWDATKVAAYLAAKAVNPSNADMWIFAKDTNDDFSPALLDKLWFGSTFSPRGHYVYNVFNMQRSANVPALATSSDFSTDWRPSTCTYYAGRLFSAGIPNSKLVGTILFSKVVEDVDLDPGIAYQVADPTSEVISDLVATDGGTIKIPEAGIIHKLLPIGDGVAVFAQNGVWQISGSPQTGFAADLLGINKITSVGTDSPKSVVSVEGNAMYWAKSGIYALAVGQNGKLAATNISQTTIQSEFESIPFNQISNTKGIYDPLEREVKWYYALDPAVAAYDIRYTNMLTLDLRLQAFYKSSYSGTAGTNPHVVAPFATLNSNSSITHYGTSVRNFCVLKNGTTWDYTVSVTHSDTFLDWFSEDSTGVDYLSFLETGYELFEDAMRKKQVDYVFIYLDRTELTATNGILNNPSSCLMQYRFDWADSATAQKWANQQEVYVYTQPFVLTFSPSNPGTEVFDYGYSVIVKKEKVMGTGRALQVRFESSTGKDMKLLGWATLHSGGTQP